MRKVLTVLLVVTVMFTLLTACDNEPKAKKVVSKAAVTKEDTSSSAPDSSSTEAITTTSKAPEGTTATPTVTQAPASGTIAPKVTTKTPQQTVAPKVTQVAQTQKKLIVPTAAQCAIIENEIMRLVNEYRVSLGLTPYRTESKLVQGARIRAKECSTRGNFGHERPDGSKWSTVLTDVKYGRLNTFQELVNGQWVTKSLYGAGASAENLAGSSSIAICIERTHGTGSWYNYFECSNSELKEVAKHLFNGWKASPDHNKSMINSVYTKMGVGVFSQYETTLQGEKDVAFYCIQLFTQE